MTMQHKNTCPFCGVASAPGLFAESQHFCAIYNIAPILPGHSLVIPKRHVESIMELGDRELSEFVIFGRNVIRLVQGVFGTSAFNWTIQEGAAAGQTIRHLHMHLIPRKAGDLPHPGDWYPRLTESENGLIDSSRRQQLTREQLREIARRIKDIGGGTQ